MELVYDVIIRNIPDVLRSRDVLFQRLKDRAEEKGLSAVMLCFVTPGQGGRPGTCFASFEDLTRNDRMARWSGMVFHWNRLKFEAHRRVRISWDNVEERWNRTQREPVPEQETEPEQVPGRGQEQQPESEQETDYATLARDNSWDDGGVDAKPNQGGM